MNNLNKDLCNRLKEAWLINKDIISFEDITEMTPFKVEKKLRGAKMISNIKIEYKDWIYHISDSFWFTIVKYSFESELSKLIVEAWIETMLNYLLDNNLIWKNSLKDYLNNN